MGVISDEKLQELRELSGGNDDLLKELLNKYLTNIDKYLSNARNALKEDNADEIQFAVHTMKGSSLSLGLTKLGNLLTDLNVKVKNGDLTGCGEALDEVQSLVKEVEEYRSTLGE